MYLLFDIGGSQTRLAISKDGKTISGEKKFATIQNFKEAIKVIREEVFKLTNGEKIEAAAGGIAGPFDQTRSHLLNAPHLTDWINKPIKNTFEEIFRCNVFLENDAAMAGLGEAVFGSGKNSEIVAFIGIGTGVGGSRIVSKKIDKTTIGYEPGHHIINFKDNDVVYFEELVSGSGIKTMFGKNATEITDEKILDNIAQTIAFGLNNVTVFWSPEVIILGGGLIVNDKVHIEKIQYHLNNILRIYPVKPKLLKASLGDMSGLYGALAYLQKS
jgi:glucokinase